jgi:HD-like signal output (HDOD) protein
VAPPGNQAANRENKHHFLSGSSIRRNRNAMWTLFFIILLIIGILFYLLFSQKNKKDHLANSKSRKREPAKRDERTGSPESHATSSRSLLQNIILDDTGMLIPELERSDQSKELKKRIQDGIDIIFSAKPGMVSGKKRPLQLKDIDLGVKEIVLRHVSHLEDFKVAYQLSKTLDDPAMSMSQLSNLIVTDPILTGKVLKVANSAYFGMEHRVNSVGRALVVIGLLNLKNILYQEGLLKLLNMKSSVKDFTVESLWEHTTLTSICASYIYNLFNGLDKGALFTMGLLHDIGKFVITSLNPLKPIDGDFTKISLAEFSLYDEDDLFGINHAVIGQLIFEEWGFPDLMVRTVGNHHLPSIEEMDSLCLDQEHLRYLLVLFLSDQVAKLFASEEQSIPPIVPLASSYHPLFPKKKFLSLILDISLFSQIRKAKAIMKGRKS